MYIVRRNDGEDIDVFDDWDLATEWSQCVGYPVEEEPIIDRETLNVMLKTQQDSDGDIT